MYLWRKTAGIHWVQAHEELLQAHAHDKLVIVNRSQRKLVQLEIVCGSREASRRLVARFGGRTEKLPRNWLERFALDNSKPIRIGNRLMIVRSIDRMQSCRVRCPQRNSHRGAKADGLNTAHSTAQTIKPQPLVIPASIAFGTGEHATTAMSLRLLEELTRDWKYGWSLVDLGTGSGILALSAKRFGAGHVVGIDGDSTAISTAKSNARLNNIHGVIFRSGDVLQCKWPRKAEVITANLYSDLLREILPKLHGAKWLILSGVLRTQEHEFVHALRLHKIQVMRIKRRGKWLAFLARPSTLVVRAVFSAVSFAPRAVSPTSA